MSTKKIVAILCCTLVFGVLVYCGLWYSTYKEEISKRQAFVAQEKNVSNSISAMFGIIKQRTQITDASRASFERIFPKIMEAKGLGKGGALMKWIQEAAPPSYEIQKDFAALATSVEAQRMIFKNEQTKLIDREREYNEFIEDPMALHFVGKKKPMVAKIIMVESAAETVKSGVEKDASLDLSLGQDKPAKK